jgi:hypothetical protein
MLEQQAGHLDLPLLRRLLADHYESQAAGRALPGLAACCTTALGADGPAVVWWSLGGVGALILPLFLDGELPAALDRQRPDSLYDKLQALQTEADRPEGRTLRTSLGRLQARIDQETEDFLVEARGFKARGEHATLSRLAGLFMQNYVELIEAEWRRWRGLPERGERHAAAASDLLAYVAE